jgi:hypothetical protein
MRLKMRYLFPLLVIVIGALAAAPATAAGGKVKLIASGLDSPRGIVFLGDRALVAEAGHGAADCGTSCGGTIGNTSQISWVNTRTGNVTRLVGGFFSLNLGAEGSLGVTGLAYRGDRVYAQISATSKEVPPGLAIGQQAGDLITVNPRNGTWKKVADVGDFDFDFTTQFTQPTPGVFSPGTQEHDANPTGILATEHGILVADSGANTLSKVTDGGTVSVVHYFDWRDPNPNNFPNDEVPTCVTSTGEALWVGTLAGHLYRVKGGNVTAVVPKDASGNPLLTHVTGCTADGEDAIYLVNMFGSGQFGSATFLNGSVVKYNPEDGKGSMVADAAGNPALSLPYMDTIGPDGNLYVTAGAVCPVSGASPFPPGAPNPCTVGTAKGGRVVMISLKHEDDGGEGNHR